MYIPLLQVAVFGGLKPDVYVYFHNKLLFYFYLTERIVRFQAPVWGNQCQYHSINGTERRWWHIPASSNHLIYCQCLARVQSDLIESQKVDSGIIGAPRHLQHVYRGVIAQ